MNKFILIVVGFFIISFSSCIDDPSPSEDTVIRPSERDNGHPSPLPDRGNDQGNPGGGENPETNSGNDTPSGETQSLSLLIDLNDLPNYAHQIVPNYINKNNSRGADITDEGATLGRVLFYDRNLSVDNSISCASCHQQQHAFSDPGQTSTGVAGLTARHSMRLINVQFANEVRFFWDERARSLEDQTLMPIQDHIEMGFSGTNGDPDFNDLIEKLEAIEYYQQLFTWVYGSPDINGTRIQDALAQFIRSIQSFDSKYDTGRALTGNDNANFPNFTAAENRGKNLFMRRPNNGPNGRNGGGLGCQGCHEAPEFDIDPNSRNNGVVSVIGDANAIDRTITRSPTLRDIFNSSGALNSPLMHTGDFSIEKMIAHYNEIPNTQGNTNLDRRLRRQRLNLTEQERNDLIAFLKTLSGHSIYEDPKLSSPF